MMPAVGRSSRRAVSQPSHCHRTRSAVARAVSGSANRFGTMPWSDAPWQASLQRLAGAEPGLVDMPEGQRLMVQVVLVDADNGSVRALRVLVGEPVSVSRWTASPTAVALVFAAASSAKLSSSARRQ